MKCPICNKVMHEVRREVTNNFKAGKDFKEYNKITYECKDDDVWVVTEIPLKEKSKIKK